MENQNGLCLQHQLFIKSWRDKKRFIANTNLKCRQNAINLGFKGRKKTEIASEAFGPEVDISVHLDINCNVSEILNLKLKVSLEQF